MTALDIGRTRQPRHCPALLPLGAAQRDRVAVGARLTPGTAWGEDGINFAESQSGTLSLVGQSSATHVQLQVRDTGSGIPVAQLPKIFEPLYTARSGGTGLGLSIVQEIVTAHGGTVTVESTEGHGSTFTITLPRAASAASIPSADEADAPR